MYPGTTEEFLRPLLEEGSGLRAGRDFHLAYSPSRVDPGNRDHTPANTPKVIGGLTPACTESAAAFYGRLTDKVVRARGPREAETVQLLETNYRHVNIALVNEMAVLCHDLGVDLWDVIRCAETKPFGFQAFRPGPGVGGHAVPRDLAGPRTRSLRMVELAQQVNNHMPQYVIQRAATLLNEHGKSARGARVLLLGITYKPDHADQQGSPAKEIATRLMELGAAVSYHDPLVPSWSILDRPVPRVDSLYEAAADADLTILLQQHRTYDLQGLSVKAQLLLDTRGLRPRGRRTGCDRGRAGRSRASAAGGTERSTPVPYKGWRPPQGLLRWPPGWFTECPPLLCLGAAAHQRWSPPQRSLRQAPGWFTECPPLVGLGVAAHHPKIRKIHLLRHFTVHRRIRSQRVGLRWRPMGAPFHDATH